MTSGYFTIGTERNFQPEVCYLCGKQLQEPLSEDHILPDNLFTKGDPNRPKLLVHHACNQSKSMDDQWFAKMVLLRCGFDARAEKKFSEFMDEAIRQKSDAFLIGKRPTEYVLAKKIFDQAKWGLEFIKDGRELKLLELPGVEKDRFIGYLKNLFKGLYLLKVEGANPSEPEILASKQYADLDLRGDREVFFAPIKSLYKPRDPNIFGQRWGNILYFGSRVSETPDKGYVFIEFYGELGILAAFD